MTSYEKIIKKLYCLCADEYMIKYCAFGKCERCCPKQVGDKECPIHYDKVFHLLMNIHAFPKDIVNLIYKYYDETYTCSKCHNNIEEIKDLGENLRWCDLCGFSFCSGCDDMKKIFSKPSDSVYMCSGCMHDECYQCEKCDEYIELPSEYEWCDQNKSNKLWGCKKCQLSVCEDCKQEFLATCDNCVDTYCHKCKMFYYCPECQFCLCEGCHENDEYCEACRVKCE